MKALHQNFYPSTGLIIVTMEAIERMIRGGVEFVKANIDLASASSTAQEILEVESEIRDITVIPPCTVRSVSLEIIRRT
jgi:hypothetical protein